MPENSSLTVYIGADHRGFALKAQLKNWLATQGYQVSDCGNTNLDQDDDYPDFSVAVAESVTKNQPESRGIVLCGSGVGATAAANKVKGARAAIALNPTMAMNGRHDDDFNILIVASDFQPFSEVQAIITAFLETEYDGDDRYQRRLNKINEYEQQSS